MRISADSRGLSRNGRNIHVHPEIPFITIRPTIERPINQSVPPAPLEIRDAVFQELIRISPASNYMEELVTGPGGLLSRGLIEDDAIPYEALPSTNTGARKPCRDLEWTCASTVISHDREFHRKEIEWGHTKL